MITSRKSLPQSECIRLVELFNAGQLAELENRSRILLRKYPASGFAWKVLGLSLHAQGKEALPTLQKAALFSPNDADAHNNLGAALEKDGQLDQAVTSYRRALKIKPDFVEAYRNLGDVLKNLGQLENAAASYRGALQIKPDFVEALILLGNTQKDLGQMENALASYRQAVEIKPDFKEAFVYLGNAFVDLGQLENALASYRRALEIKPDYADALYNQGNALRDRCLLDEAVASYRRAVEIKPDYAEALYNQGNVLKDLGLFDEAIDCYRRALEINPDYVDAHTNLGIALISIGQLDAAVVSCRQALEINPDNANAPNNLGHALEALGQLDDALASYRRALEIKSDFVLAHNNAGHVLVALGQLDQAVTSYRRGLEINPDYADAHSNLLFIHSYLSAQTAPMLLAEAQRFGNLATQNARPLKSWQNVLAYNRCLRVGLVSGDLCNHPVGYFIEGILAELASSYHDQLQLFAYPTFFRDDAVTERIKSHCHGWHSAVGLSDEMLAQQLRNDGIDILIDLAGHTAHNRLLLFAWKPAPVQVSWLGYFATTGLEAMDYLLADPWTVPAAEETHFTEKIWRLPETYLCFTPPDIDLQVASLPGLANSHITFGCFNNLAKMNDAVVALWARTLQAVPESRLFLKTKQLDEATVRQSVMNRFAAHGIAAERLILEGAAPRAELLAAYHRLDIALDPFPYPGGTTSVEALWMGVPVLTLVGDRFLSHIGESLLHNAGLPEWIAADADDYVARAVLHAGDLERLAALRTQLRQQVLASPLFDAPRFARHFEAALRGMWTQWCNQQQEKLQ